MTTQPATSTQPEWGDIYDHQLGAARHPRHEATQPQPQAEHRSTGVIGLIRNLVR